MADASEKAQILTDELADIYNGLLGEGYTEAEAEELQSRIAHLDHPKPTGAIEPGHCPTCGTPVEVVSSDEGTSFYRPVLTPEALRRIRNALPSETQVEHWRRHVRVGGSLDKSSAGAALKALEWVRRIAEDLETAE